MLDDHEDHGDEEEGANGFAEKHLWNQIAAVVAAVAWAKLSNVISALSDLLCVAVLLEGETASSDGGTESGADALGNNDSNGKGEVPHPILFSLLEEHC